ncbi:MAG: hypothetical protein H6811_00600 [Phycisphaeraceae bacterium]|nr:hypothetical protein [Phycisphaeraceae bacterium]
MPIESAIPLSDDDRAILRALLTRVPGPASAAPRPRSDPIDHLAPASEPVACPSLLEALTAAGLDELDLPLWFAQPHIQGYIEARRALDDFLDEQSSRAARREGLELLRTLPALTRAQRAASAASGPCSDPPGARADASPSEPARAAGSLKELRLIATALLRTPLPNPPRPPRSRAHARVESAQTAPVPGPDGNSNSSCFDPRPGPSHGHARLLAPVDAPGRSPSDTTRTALSAIDDAIARVLAALHERTLDPGSAGSDGASASFVPANSIDTDPSIDTG